MEGKEFLDVNDLFDLVHNFKKKVNGDLNFQ